MASEWPCSARTAGIEEIPHEGTATLGVRVSPGQPFDTLSGGQQARLQILLLDLAITHDRLFAADFDRYLHFTRAGDVREVPEPVWY